MDMLKAFGKVKHSLLFQKLLTKGLLFMYGKQVANKGAALHVCCKQTSKLQTKGLLFMYDKQVANKKGLLFMYDKQVANKGAALHVWQASCKQRGCSSCMTSKLQTKGLLFMYDKQVANKGAALHV